MDPMGPWDAGTPSGSLPAVWDVNSTWFHVEKTCRVVFVFLWEATYLAWRTCGNLLDLWRSNECLTSSDVISLRCYWLCYIYLHMFNCNEMCCWYAIICTSCIHIYYSNAIIFMYANILQKYPPILQYYTSIPIYHYIYIYTFQNDPTIPLIRETDNSLGGVFVCLGIVCTHRLSAGKHVLISNGWFISTFRNVLRMDA